MDYVEVMTVLQIKAFKVLPVCGGCGVKSVAPSTSLHRPNRVGTRAARIALKLIVCGECCIEFGLFTRILADILDAIINLAGSQFFEQIFWHSHEQQSWKCFYEKAPHPWCHFMC